MMRTPCLATALLIAFSSSLGPSPKYKELGVPRDAQRRVLMEAPPKRPADEPDVSGNWFGTDCAPLAEELGRRHRAAKRTSEHLARKPCLLGRIDDPFPDRKMPGARPKNRRTRSEQPPYKFMAKWPRV